MLGRNMLSLMYSHRFSCNLHDCTLTSSPLIIRLAPVSWGGCGCSEVKTLHTVCFWDYGWFRGIGGGRSEHSCSPQAVPGLITNAGKPGRALLSLLLDFQNLATSLNHWPWYTVAFALVTGLHLFLILAVAVLSFMFWYSCFMHGKQKSHYLIVVQFRVNAFTAVHPQKSVERILYKSIRTISCTSQIIHNGEEKKSNIKNPVSCSSRVCRGHSGYSSIPHMPKMCMLINVKRVWLVVCLYGIDWWIGIPHLYIVYILSMSMSLNNCKFYSFDSITFGTCVLDIKTTWLDFKNFKIIDVDMSCESMKWETFVPF